MVNSTLAWREGAHSSVEGKVEMTKEATIYVIEYQNSIGAWQINGFAFIDKEAADRRVNMLTVKELTEHMQRDEFAGALELDLEKDSQLLTGQGDETLYAIVDTLEDRGKASLISEAAEEFRDGGFYSYEQVGLVGSAD